VRSLVTGKLILDGKPSEEFDFQTIRQPGEALIRRHEVMSRVLWIGLNDVRMFTDNVKMMGFPAAAFGGYQFRRRPEEAAWPHEDEEAGG
jgi:hypothetical protein